MRKIGIIGAGSWGTALAVNLTRNNHEVTIWSIMADEIKMLEEKREHIDKLPGVKLDESMKFTTDMETAIKGMDMLVLAVPSIFTRSTSKLMTSFVEAGQIIACVAKGIEDDTFMTITDIVEEEIPQADVCVLCGPSHAEEVGIGLPTTVVAGAKSRKSAEFIQDTFMNETFRVYTSPDMLGMELGGSLKNVIALAAGMCDGLGFGDNTKAALIVRGISEVARLATAMGANPETVKGLTGVGDLIVTCQSKHSRNRKAGELMGQGMTMDEATKAVKMVVEGIYSAKSAYGLGKKYEVSMPIIEEVNKVLFENKSAKEAVYDLMLREKCAENLFPDWQ